MRAVCLRALSHWNREARVASAREVVGPECLQCGVVSAWQGMAIDLANGDNTSPGTSDENGVCDV